jgi:hypothetical protein
MDATTRLTIAAPLATCRSADSYAGASRPLFGELDVLCGWGLNGMRVRFVSEGYVSGGM